MIKFQCPGCPTVYSVDQHRGWNKETCPSCRSEFIIPGDEAETSRSTGSSRTHPPTPKPTPRPGANPPHIESKRIVAGVMAIFLGAFGVHKFVLGYTRAGLIQLALTFASCGMMKFFAILEGLIYLTKSDAEFVKTYQVGKKEWL